MAPLRAVGIDIKFLERKNNMRPIKITMPEIASPSSLASQTVPNPSVSPQINRGFGSGGDGDANDANSSTHDREQQEVVEV